MGKVTKRSKLIEQNIYLFPPKGGSIKRFISSQSVWVWYAVTLDGRTDDPSLTKIPRKGINIHVPYYFIVTLMN